MGHEASDVVNDPLHFWGEELAYGRVALYQAPPLNAQSGDAEQYLVTWGGQYAHWSLVKGKYLCLRSFGLYDFSREVAPPPPWRLMHGPLTAELLHPLAGWLWTVAKEKP